jgi:polyhydroxyalkanoate synthase
VSEGIGNNDRSIEVAFMIETGSPVTSAENAVGGGEPAGSPKIGGVFAALTALPRHSASLGKAGTEFLTEASRIAIGRSTVVPARGDWRFKDPTWSANPLYKRLAQSYLTACHAIDALVDEVATKTGDKRGEELRFAAGIFTSAAAPTNTLLGNPVALKKTLETGGRNILRGSRQLLSDLRHNGGMPSMAKPGALKVGEHMAITPGRVIDKDQCAELLQYAPSTETVRERPMLIVPPPIGRYYFLDLRPGRSFVEYSVSRGLQTFMISWRDPGPEQADWAIDTYAQRVMDAINVVREVTGSADVNVIGFCAGGILNAGVLNYLAATEPAKVHAASFAVTLLDFGLPAPIAAFSSPRLLSLARWNSTRKGVIGARAMGAVFTWMRPNDLVWNYWVNNYLMGEEPPVFDILAWNADGTNLPAALHQQFLDIFQNNPLPTPGSAEALGLPIDLATIKLPTYVVGAVADHLTPWQGTYRTTQLLAGESRFVLSNAGHIASLVNPPCNAKASYFTGPTNRDESADEWFGHAEKRSGSWWEDWADWALEHSGNERMAPRTLGSDRFHAGESAPGSYVRMHA